MNNNLKQTLLKILAIVGVIAAVAVLIFAYVNMFKNLKAKPNQEQQTTVTQPEKANQVVPVPAVSQIGIIANLVTNPDGSVTLTIDVQRPVGQKTYQLPKNQTITLYTSKTQKSSVPVGQLKKDMIVNVVTLSDPQSYVIVGVTDKAFAEVLL